MGGYAEGNLSFGFDTINGEMARIAKKLNEKAIRTKRDLGKWYASSVKKVYAGKVISKIAFNRVQRKVP